MRNNHGQQADRERAAVRNVQRAHQPGRDRRDRRRTGYADTGALYSCIDDAMGARDTDGDCG